VRSQHRRPARVSGRRVSSIPSQRWQPRRSDSAYPHNTTHQRRPQGQSHRADTIKVRRDVTPESLHRVPDCHCTGVSSARLTPLTYTSYISRPHSRRNPQSKGRTHRSRRHRISVVGKEYRGTGTIISTISLGPLTQLKAWTPRRALTQSRR